MSALPAGWVSARLGEIAETRLGKMLSTKAKTGVGSRPYLRNKNVQWGRFDLGDLEEMDFSPDEFKRFEVVPGDLLVCEGGEVGRAAIWRGQLDGIAYQKALHRVRPGSESSSEYLLYALMWLAQTGAFDAFVTGSTIKHLPQEALRELPIPLAPLPEQQRIVAAIEEQFSRLDAAHRSLRTARARIDLYNASTVLDGLAGDWPLVRLGDLTAEQHYGTSAKANEDPTGVPILRMGNIQNGRLSLDKLKYLPNDHPDLERLILDPGDLLFNRTNSPELVGKSAIYEGFPAQASFASYLIRVRLLPACLPGWASLVLNSQRGRAYMAEVRTQQVGQANVNGTKLAAMPIPLPPVDEQGRILEFLELHRSRAALAQGSIGAAQRRASALRRSILERALGGELLPVVSERELRMGRTVAADDAGDSSRAVTA